MFPNIGLSTDEIYGFFVMKHEVNNCVSLYNLITASCSLYNSEKPQLNKKQVLSSGMKTICVCLPQGT